MGEVLGARERSVFSITDRTSFCEVHPKTSDRLMKYYREEKHVLAACLLNEMEVVLHQIVRNKCGL